MKTALAGICVSLFTGVALANAASGIPESTLRFAAQAWTSECRTLTDGQPAGDCSLPHPIVGGEKPLLIEMPLGAVTEAGNVQTRATDFRIDATDPASSITGRISLYSIYPHTDSPWPPYVQIRIELFAPARVVCLQSVRWRQPFEMPPLICAGFAGGSQFGLNLIHRDNPIPPKP